MTSEASPSVPRPQSGSPEEPSDGAAPSLGQRVVIDTNVVLREDFRMPLAVLAIHGFLDVRWSPWVAGEVARVATRENVLPLLRNQVSRENVRSAMERVRQQIDIAIAFHERIWDSPIASELDAASSDPVITLVRDDADKPVLAAAIAVGASVLLSLDKGFRHGARYGHIMSWHPDTYLTGLFARNRDVYDVVREEIDAVPKVSLLP